MSKSTKTVGFAVAKERIPVPDNFCLQAIATDMDGTFFSSKMSVLPTTLEAYRRAKSMGLTIIPATGRAKEGVELALKAVGADDVSLFPGVYLNGAVVYGPEGNLLMECVLPEHVIEKMIRYAKETNERVMSEPDWQENPNVKDPEPEHGMMPVVDRSLKPTFVTLRFYTRNGLVCSEVDQLIDGMRQSNEGVDVPVGDLLAYSKQCPVYKILLISHSGEIIGPMMHEVSEMLEDEVEVCSAIPRLLEVSPKGVNKRKGLLALVDRLGVSLETMASLGDGNNDVEMLKSSGYSILMGNSSPCLRDVADVLTKTNTRDGWAIAVQSLVSKKVKDMKGKKKPQFELVGRFPLGETLEGDEDEDEDEDEEEEDEEEDLSTTVECEVISTKDIKF